LCVVPELERELKQQLNAISSITGLKVR